MRRGCPHTPRAFERLLVPVRTTAWRPRRRDLEDSGRRLPPRGRKARSRRESGPIRARACADSPARAERRRAASRPTRTGVRNRLPRKAIAQPRQAVGAVEIAVPLTDALLDLNAVSLSARP